jgi:hypothetical protein
MTMTDYPGKKPPRSLRRRVPKTDRKLRRDRGIAGYKTLHKNLQTMSRKELIAAMQDELNRRGAARPDLFSRLVGRYNRLESQRITQGLMGLLGYKGKRSVASVLGSDG